MPVVPFRDLGNQPGNSAPWMRDGTGERLNYTFNLMADARLERLVQGIMCRIPRSTIANNYQAPSDALQVIGGDRSISQGPNESNASFALRLQQAPSEWAIWGSPRSVLDQVCAYFTPMPVTARIVTNSGHWYSMSTPGNVYTVLPPLLRPPAIANNWIWDGNGSWWRAWLIVYFPVGYANTFNWDSGPAWDSGPLWDGVPKGTFDQLATIANLWYPAHAKANGSFAGLITTTLQPTDLIPGQLVHPFDPSSTLTTNADGSTNLPAGNWASPVWTTGPNIGKNSRPQWATFYDINNA